MGCFSCKKIHIKIGVWIKICSQKMAVAVLVKLPAEECLDQKTVVNLHCKFNMRDLKKFSQCIKDIFEQ